MRDGELWHIVEAKRDDGTPTTFRIRELDPRKQLDKIFVVEMPYPATEMSRLPSAAAYRRLGEFEEQWLRPACSSLGWELVGSKIEDGSFFQYMYGAGDPNELIAKLSPFDSNLGFYDDADPDWLEYATLRELLEQAKAIPRLEPPAAYPEATAPARSAKRKQPAAKRKQPAAKPKKPTKSAKQPTKSAKQPTKSAKQPTKSAKQPTKSAKQPTKSATKPTKSATKPTKSAKRR